MYASAIYTGQLTIGDLALKCTYFDLFGCGFWYSDQANATILSMDSELYNLTEVAYMNVAESTWMALERAYSANFTVVDGQLYVGFVGLGTFNYANGDNTGQITFAPDGDMGFNEYGFLILNGDANFTASYVNPTTTPMYSIGGMAVVEDNLVVVGTIADSSTDYDAATPAKICAWTLDAATMEGEIAECTIDNGTSVSDDNEQPNNAKARSIAVLGSNILVNTLVTTYWQDVVDVENIWFAGNEFEASSVAGAGIAANGAILAANAYDINDNETTVTSYKDEALYIGAINGDAAEVVSQCYYNLQGQAVSAPARNSVVVKVETLSNGVQRASKVVY